VFPSFILKKYPHMHAILIDLVNVCKEAEEVFHSSSISDRAKAIPVDMFKDSLPTKFTKNNSTDSVSVDIVFFSQILHDWDIETATKLLARAYEILPEGQLLLQMHYEYVILDRRSTIHICKIGRNDDFCWI